MLELNDNFVSPTSTLSSPIELPHIKEEDSYDS